jgi:uncharacterized protein (TIGR02452 family)
MNAQLRAIAQENEDIVAAGGYTAPDGRNVTIAAAVAAAQDGTRMYGPDPVPVPVPEAAPVARTVVEVTSESSLEAARRLVESGDGPVVVLNFASARNPGGGYVRGTKAQEEDLCRSAALYGCLLRVPEYYDHHRAERNAFYSDRVIHSPGAPVFRDEGGRLLDEPFHVSFLTAAAPNAGVILERTPEDAHLIPAALRSRAERVLEVAAVHGYRRLVLGAWGCGVFRNDPAVVAEVFRTHLTGDGRFARRFEHIVFGVLDCRADAPTRSAFRSAFASTTGTAGTSRDVMPSP